jgi:hypothetical protein
MTDPIIAPDDVKRCSACKQLVRLTSFHKNISRPDGLAETCKPCRRKAFLATRPQLPDPAVAGWTAGARAYEHYLQKQAALTYARRGMRLTPRGLVFGLRNDHQITLTPYKASRLLKSLHEQGILSITHRTNTTKKRGRPADLYFLNPEAPEYTQDLANEFALNNPGAY